MTHSTISKKNKRPIMLLEIRRFCIFQVDFLVIAVTRLKMNWSQLMNHSSILVNQAYFYGRFISTINDYVKNDLEFCSSLLVQSFNKRTLKLRVWSPKLKVMNMDVQTKWWSLRFSRFWVKQISVKFRTDDPAVYGQQHSRFIFEIQPIYGDFNGL